MYAAKELLPLVHWKVRALARAIVRQQEPSSFGLMES